MGTMVMMAFWKELKLKKDYSDVKSNPGVSRSSLAQ